MGDYSRETRQGLENHLSGKSVSPICVLRPDPAPLGDSRCSAPGWNHSHRGPSIGQMAAPGESSPLAQTHLSETSTAVISGQEPVRYQYFPGGPVARIPSPRNQSRFSFTTLFLQKAKHLRRTRNELCSILISVEEWQSRTPPTNRSPASPTEIAFVPHQQPKRANLPRVPKDWVRCAPG